MVCPIYKPQRAPVSPLFGTSMPITTDIVFASTTKTLSCILENVSSTVPRFVGSLVSKLFSSIHKCGTHCIAGTFNPGMQPRGTPITAETVHGGDVDINVMWRDVHGRAVSSSWSKSSGWDLSNDENQLLDGRD